MVNISAKIELIDDMSSKLDRVANAGQSAIEQMDGMGSTVSSAFSTASGTATQTAQSIDGVAKSSATATAQSNDLASALDKEAEKLEGVARKLELKADSDKRLAERASEYAKIALQKTDEEGNFTEALNESAQAAQLYADKMENAAKASQGKAEAARLAAEASRNSAEEFVGSSEAADELCSSLENASQSLESYSSAASDAGGESQEFGETSSDAIGSLSNALVAAGLTKALDMIKDAFISCINEAIEFESAVTGVYKTVDGTTEQLQQISSGIREMATNMPANANEIAGVAEAAGQLGIATNDITGFTEVMINLGEATNLTADDAASSLAKFSNITGMSASNYENLGSTVVALGNTFATTEADIVAMSTRLASAGSLAGFTEPEMLALAASMSAVGIEADAGGSAMSKLLVDMQVAVETGSDRLEEFASVAGMTGVQFQEAFGNQASDALMAFISGLNDVERNGATATVILENMGITEVRLSNAVKSLANSSESVGSAIEVANTAWSENTALANEAGLRYGTLESRISMTKNAAQNLQIAIGDDLNPIIGEFVDAGRGALEWFTGIVEGNPAVTAGLTAIAIGFGVLMAGMTVFSLVHTPMIITALHAITAAMSANPIFMVVTGVVALTAAVAAFVTILKGQESEYESWTASTKNQYDELQNLNLKYEEACERYGDTSERALELRYQMDELNATFEMNKQTVEEFVAECDKLAEENDKLWQSHSEATEQIHSQEIGTYALIQKLDELSGKTRKTVADQEQMKHIIGQLNEEVPGLALNYDEVTGSMDMTAGAVRKLAEEQAKRTMFDENLNAQTEALVLQAQLMDQIAVAEANIAAEKERYYAEAGYTEQEALDWGMPNASLYSDDLATFELKQEELQGKLEEVNTRLSSLNGEIVRYGEQTEEAANQTIGFDDAVSTAFGDVQAEMDELIASYDEAYAAARQSIDGQIGLFQTMKAETKLVTDDKGNAIMDVDTVTAQMESAMQSQIDFLSQYNENIQKAADIGFNEGFIQKMSDGTEESAAQLDILIAKYEQLGGAGSQEAEDFLGNINSKYSEVEDLKNEFGDIVGDMAVNFSEKMDDMQKKLEESIAGMSKEKDAASAAKGTMDSYVKSILEGKGPAIAAAKATADGVAAALAGTPSVAVSKPSVTPARSKGISGGHNVAYATGTASAMPGLALVGEEGPELVNFGGGETVYTAPQTDRIMGGFANRDFNIPMPASSNGEKGSQDGERKISIDINGNGAIKAGNNVDRNSILDVMVENMKPVLMSIISQEVLEEGDRSYAF